MAGLIIINVILAIVYKYLIFKFCSKEKNIRNIIYAVASFLLFVSCIISIVLLSKGI